MLANQLGEPAARALVERGLHAVPGGWQWRSDPQLMLPSAVYMSEQQVCDVLAAICCPVWVVLATPAPAHLPASMRTRRLACLRNATLIQRKGPHHLHMEQAAALAPALRRFLHGDPGRSDRPAAD